MPYFRLILLLLVCAVTSTLAYSSEDNQNNIPAPLTDEVIATEPASNNETSTKDTTTTFSSTGRDNSNKIRPWEFGLSLDFNQLNELDAFGAAWAIQLGKDLSESENFIFGVQTHIGFSSSNEIKYDSDLNFKQVSFYGTARLKDLPALQFKAGITHAQYQTFYAQNSTSGLSYGMAITTEASPKLRVNWFDYEIHDLNGRSFTTISINLYIILCMFSGGGGC